MIRTYAIVASAAILSLLAGLWYSSRETSDDIFAACRSVRVAGGMSSIGGPFELVNQDGIAVTDADVITGPTLLYFGYTFCPDICPADTARNAEAVVLLEEDGMLVTPAMITIDPARDTPEVMKDFAFNLHDRMIGLTGTEEQVAAASRAYRGYFQKEADADPEFYLMSHSTQSYLALPDLGVVEVYNRNTSPQDVAESVSCFVSAAS